MNDNVIDTLTIKVEADTKTATNGLTDLQKTLSKFQGVSKTCSTSTNTISSSFSNLKGKLHSTTASFRKIVKVFGGWFNETNDYVEALNLFNVALGDCAGAAKEYAESVSAIAGIDMKEWMTYQGAFYQLADGYGLASNASERMSKNLTQLAFDLSSLWNVDAETAFQKLQSGMSGQIKGLKVWGINVSVAQLKETALAHGIDLATSKMTEAQKATLRYVTIMEQTSKAQGDMARTIATPANALRILNAQWTQAKRAMGQVVSLVAVEVIPWFQALVQVIRDVAEVLSKKYETPTPDLKDLSNTTIDPKPFDKVSDSLGKATESAKELKKTILGIDEINALTDNSVSSPTAGTTGTGNGYASDFGLDLGKYDYDFLSGLDSTDLDDKKKKLKEILSYVTAISAGFAAMAISKKLIDGISWLQKALGGVKSLSLNWSIFGAAAFFSDLDKLRQYIKDIEDNGANWSNVSGVLGEFAGSIGDVLIVLGKTEIAAPLKAVQGITEIINGVKGLSDEDTENDIDSACTAIRGLGDVGIAIGAATKNMTLAGASGALVGFTGIVSELSENWEAIKSGDWSGVDKVSLATNAVYVLAGLATALGAFNKVKDATDLTKTTEKLDEVKSATESVSTSTSALTSKLTNLVKNLGLGLVVIAEVAVAAGLIVGAIWGLGLMLQQVGEAWQPVLDNGSTVITALELGTILLLAVGVAVAALGNTGLGGVATLGVGLLALLELDAAVLLFVAAIWAVGYGLNQIGIVWQPVLDNGETVTAALERGTLLLLAVGVATAALGAITVASAGALPVAVGLGTAMLVLLAAAFVDFIGSLVVVAGQISDELYPAFERVNSVLPSLTTDMSNFKDFMGQFASMAASYAADSAIAGLSNVVGNIVNLFTGDPIQRFADNADKQYTQASNLNKKLQLANPELTTAIALLTAYNNLFSRLEALTGQNSNIQLAQGVYANLKEVGKKLVTGLVDGIKGEMSSLSNTMRRLLSDNVSSRDASSLGKDYGREFARGISSGFKGASFPTLHGNVDVSASGYVSLSLKAYAKGGFVDNGQMFIAREAGPEMVGTIGNKTSVANNEQIVSGIAQGVSDANSEQNALLREQNSLLRRLLEKDQTVRAVITAGDVVDGLNRKNRRDGKVTVPVG